MRETWKGREGTEERLRENKKKQIQEEEREIGHKPPKREEKSGKRGSREEPEVKKGSEEKRRDGEGGWGSGGSKTAWSGLTDLVRP